MDLSSIRSLFTPSVLFLLLNLVIATIALVSTRHRQQQNPRPIARSSSNVLERVRSLGLFRFRSGDLPPVPAASDDHASFAPPPPQYQQQEPVVHQQPHQQFRRIHSESASKEKTSSTKVMGKSASAVTSRSASEVYAEISRRPAAVRREAAAVADEEVDAKADDFISRFRQQLKLQRLDSLLRYKEMLKAK